LLGMQHIDSRDDQMPCKGPPLYRILWGVFSAFFDETGTTPDTDLLWIAGYIAEEKTWFEFSRHWRAVLTEHDVSALHMRLSTASRGEFLGWDESRRRPFMEDLISVINSSDLWGVAVGVDKAAFEALTRAGDGSAAVTLSGERARDPYLWAFHDAVIETANQIDHIPAETVAFVFDRQERLQSASARIFEGLRAEESWPRRFRLGSLSFDEARLRPPLQAADLLAYEIQKERKRRAGDSDRPERISLGRLRSRLIASRYWDRATLAKVVSRGAEVPGQMPSQD
jgi:hypothetical protein